MLAPPALGQMSTKYRNSGFECWATEQPGVIVSCSVAIRSVDATTEPIGKVPKWKRVTRVKLHLEVGLSPIRGERALGHHKPHNVADIELAHGRKVARCSTLEQSHVAQTPGEASRFCFHRCATWHIRRRAHDCGLFLTVFQLTGARPREPRSLAGDERPARGHEDIDGLLPRIDRRLFSDGHLPACGDIEHRARRDCWALSGKLE